MKVKRVAMFVSFCLCLFPAALFADLYAVQWADTVDNGAWDGANAVAVDQSCNIIVFGSSFINGDNDYFIVKYDSNGTFLWADMIDNGGEDLGQAVAIDDNNNIVVTGYCMISADYDYCTVKYDPGGTIIWQKILDNGGQYDIARGVAIDNAQNIVITGYCDISGDCVYLTVKYDPAGDIIWADTLDYGPFDTALDVAVDNGDNIIVTGYTTDGQNNDYLTVKYDSDGAILWQEALDIRQYDQAYGVATDNYNNVIVTGCSGDFLDDYDFFTVKYDSAGTILWTDTLDYANSEDVAYDVAVDNDNNIYVTGYGLRMSGDYNYYTFKYAPDSTGMWQDLYDNSDQDLAHGIAVDAHDKIIVTGWSYIGDDMDFFTVKYMPIPGISEHSEQWAGYPTIQVSPNPAKNRAEITYNAGQSSKGADLKIYDITGRVVKSFTVATSNSSLPITISWDCTDNNGNRLPSGVYYIVLEQEKSKVTKKLLILK
jgi:uncharacterized delta-60 repeat protein